MTFEMISFGLLFVGVLIALWVDSRGFNE